MTDDPAYTFPISAAALLGDELALSYEERADGTWAVLATANDGEKSQVIGEGNTREEAEAEAARLALALHGFAALAKGIGSLLRSKDSETGSATNARFPPLDLTGQPVQLPGDFGWRIVFDVRTDGSYEWNTYDATGRQLLQSGAEDSWDDAKLAAVLRLLPPSREN